MPIDLRDKLLGYLQEDYYIFLKEEANKLAPYRGLEINYAIKLVEKEGKPIIIP